MSKFDRFMIATEVGSNVKIGRLDDKQFRCLVTGVWALAAKSTPRGYLTVAGEPATPADIAHQGRCSVTVAKATLVVLRKMEMIEQDDQLDLEFCHDWWVMNPDPKNDPSNAERQARYRAKKRNAGNALVALEVTATEVEVEEEVEVTPPTYLTTRRVS